LLDWMLPYRENKVILKTTQLKSETLREEQNFSIVVEHFENEKHKLFHPPLSFFNFSCLISDVFSTSFGRRFFGVCSWPSSPTFSSRMLSLLGGACHWFCLRSWSI
jgi:hypothetical protein